MTARFRLVALAFFSCVLGCTPPAPTTGAPSAPPAAIAGLHARKCGPCHAVPEPRTRTREHLEAAFVRHKNRVRLSAQEWSAMVDYLAAPGATGDLQGH